MGETSFIDDRPRAQFPKKLQFLFEPHPYKILYGGRGGIKSWSIATALVIIAARRKTRILCLRELEKSIGESVHELLKTQIFRLGLQAKFDIKDNRITSSCGSEIVFRGLRDTQNLKSYEGFDIFFVEEAVNVTKRSWDIIMPTIRKEDSELWIAFNPELTTDPTYEMWVLHPPPGAIVLKTSWRDNAWLTEKLRKQIEHKRLTDPDGYLHVYEGHCRTSLEGAIYVDEMRLLTAGERIRNVPYNPKFPVHTFWDLGFADQTAIWFVQSIGFEHRFIDFYRNNRKPLSHYLAELKNDRPYHYATHYMPHDARAHQLGTGKSIEELAITAGLEVKIVPDIGVAMGINAARELFSNSYFDESKTKDGVDALRRYRYKVDPETKIMSKTPFHDDASNPADAYRMAAVALTEPERVKRAENNRPTRPKSPWS